MKSRIARLGVLLVPVMALFSSLAPPAGATEVGAVVLQGTATVGNGIAYPCADGKTTPPSINTAKCMPPQLGNPNNAAFIFNATAVGAIVKVNKPAKCPGTACASAGIYTIATAGTVNGSCALSIGTGGGGAISDQTVVSTKPGTARGINTFGWTGVGGLLVVTGSMADGATIVGAVVAVPDPTNGSTCANKTAKRFIVAGAMVLIRVP